MKVLDNQLLIHSGHAFSGAHMSVVLCASMISMTLH